MTSHDSLRLFNWNVWLGGWAVGDGMKKVSEIVEAEKADIVFLQECFGPVAARTGERTGMSVVQWGHDTALLTSAPVQPVLTSTAPYATAAIVESHIGDVLAWSVHLEHTDYGPYRIDDLPEAAETVFAQAGEQKRDDQARTILEETDRLQREFGPMPVIVAGDFNVPVGTDWNGEGRPCVTWPATGRFIDAGYTDAFRHIHPDPQTAPGLTWSHIEPAASEPRDRIDFIFTLGLTPTHADHFGSGADDLDLADDEGFVHHAGVCRHIPDHEPNAFPSDHLAVRATVHA